MDLEKTYNSVDEEVCSCRTLKMRIFRVGVDGISLEEGIGSGGG